MAHVKTEDWMPDPAKSILDYTPEFVAWIDSINSGFRNRITYEPFELYREQCQTWFGEDVSISDFNTKGDKMEYVKQEILRYRQSSMYFGNRQIRLKEGDVTAGEVRYKAWPCQEIILFLIDCGYNLLIGKGRQIGFSSTIGGPVAIKRAAYIKNYFTKFITHSKVKGEEIFDDKIKYAYENIDPWSKPTPGNYTQNLMRLFSEEGKAEKGGTGSKIQVVSPRVDAINGGSPNLVLIDEVASILIFSSMMNEGRPTLFRTDEDGTLRLIRQLVAWGTGGVNDTANHVFEGEWNAATLAWNDKDYDYGMIPLFFDFWARRGMTQEFYLKEKKRYYSKIGPELEKSKIQFHQHYPNSPEDMFLVTSKTLISIEKINAMLTKIGDLADEDKPVYGYFEPVFDTSVVNPEDKYLPFKLTGANFRKTSGMEDPRTTTIMFQDYEPGWANRYWKGTDPINAETGHSKFSSSIWDKHVCTVSCVLNFRDEMPKTAYVQSMLMLIYYGYPYELPERNIGQEYMEYMDMKGLSQFIVPNKILPPYLQTPSTGYLGIANTRSTGKHIINKLQELLDSYADNIFIREFWIQLKTFTEKTLPGGKTRYQAQDLRYYWDDILFSVANAYIAAESYPNLLPKKIETDTSGERTTRKLIRDSSWRLRLAEVRVSDGKVIRFIHM